MTAQAVPRVPQCRFCNETPFLVAPIVSQGLLPGFSLTTVVKASFRLVPGEPLSPCVPQIQFRGDEWVGEDFHGGLHHGTDLVAWKPRTDVLMRAACHVPAGTPASRCEAGFAVGDWQKTVQVVGERTWKVGLFGRIPGEPHPFTTMPLDWEHAYGGAGYEANPAGKGFGTDLLPNVEDPAQPLAGYGDRVAPAGFLPINRMWQARMRKMGRADGTYLTKRFPLPPDDFTWTYLNEAPEDQQLVNPLRGDEELRFQHVHPAAPAWSVRLPGQRIRGFIEDTDEDGASRVRELEMRCDTLLANVEEGYLHLLWRGFLPIRSENRAEVTTFYIVEEPLAGPVKSFAEHAANLRQAKDLGQKLGAEIEGKVGEVTAKTAEVLKRYGLAMPDLTVPGRPGPTAEQLACFPLNPHGPLPANAARFQGRLDEADRLRNEALGKLRPLGTEHGVDIDAPVALKPEALLASYRKGLEDSVALLKAQGRAVPEAIAQQLHEVSRPGGDPFGIAKLAAEFKKAGLALASHSSPVVQAIARGDAQAIITAAAQPASQPPTAGLPGATPPPVVPSAPALPETWVLPKVASPEALPAFVDPGRPRDLPPRRPRLAGAPDNAAMRAFLAGGGACRGRNFAGADFSGLDLSGHDFTGALLFNACFRGAKLTGAIFSSTLLRQADFITADLRDARLGFCDYQEADFSYVRLSGAHLTQTALIETRFVGADLSGATFDRVLANGADFTGADLSGVSAVSGGVWSESQLDRIRARGSRWDQVLFSGCSLVDADFSHSTITDTVLMTCDARRLLLAESRLKGLRAFNGTDLQGAIMTGSRMRDTSWMYVRLDEADFSGGDLRQANFMFASGLKTRFVGADLKGAVLRHARLQGADLTRANLCRATFGRADLTLANLEQTNCYETDFQDAIVLQTRFQEANLIRTNLRRA